MQVTANPVFASAPARAAGRFWSWRWIHVAVAAGAMVATLPGRTQGLGLFTEPILRSLHLGRESYAFMNLWATLLGGLFCLPCGWLLDRVGTRSILTGVTVALGAVVCVMSQVQGAWAFPLSLGGPAGISFSVVILADLFVALLLTRGLGQSALSVASLALIGRSARRRTGLIMGVYAFLTAAGFIGAFTILRKVITAHPEAWRSQWAGIGAAVMIAGVVFGLLVKNFYLDSDAASSAESSTDLPEPSRTLRQALRSPAFWTFSVGTSFYGMVAAGISLFNESILAERHFTKEVFLELTVLAIPFGLASNLLGGWLATRIPLARLLGAAMALLAITLGAFPFVETLPQAYAYTIAFATAGGFITVCFFTVWRRGFGPAHLGQVQGAAQMLTVVFSALGPQLFASVQARMHSYLPLFTWLGASAAALAVATLVIGLPEVGHTAYTHRKGPAHA